ncbi:MAG TPA: glycine cleavage system aminomethyltransferase GcvT [Acidobacteriota bacterium]|nr:glycine cleavage system aminomethyltransferase GcvT [Acidobacteriota bacterium]HNT18158.1 glycine cleavage system aminomethyltransferase GcvT [Acidobacteriota bacterium]HPA27009.1 glycine cleavage system aminomethyltransferase GcvT [Acidobacteriota bacterium]HQO20401.1 glycine cleavage system aminomethyltransferase GcvT [Acidobacteriota bacterium]HQQ47313.1 glycine cleavage system aminomethyltransferase GcvT [Acidobacteriota bacterium]
METLKRTPLFEEHRKCGGKIVPFAGWEMPVQYSGLIDEHITVRTKAGLFDVSHMGEIWVKGKDALKLVQKVSSNDATKLAYGQIHYAGLLTEKGTFVDDMLVHKIEDNFYLLVVNASNVDKDFAFIKKNAEGMEVNVVNKSDEIAQIAIQGPLSVEIMPQFVKGADIAALKYYWFTYGEVLGEKCLIARTGYTGEDGFEVYLSPAKAPELWNALLEKGTPMGLKPAGLGARDTLRLEACMTLYGNDIDDTTTTLEADLGWITKLDKPDDFNGKAILLEQKAKGVSKKLVAFELLEAGIPRHEMACFHEGAKVGHVTSGTMAPFVKKALGMAYLPIGLCEAGKEFHVDIRGKMVKAKVVPKPFYKRPKK